MSSFLFQTILHVKKSPESCWKNAKVQSNSTFRCHKNTGSQINNNDQKKTSQALTARQKLYRKFDKSCQLDFTKIT